MRLGEPSRMTLRGIGIDREVEVFGDAPDTARNAPLTAESVKERLAKMGNTFLSLSVDDIDLELDEGINLSPSAINKLRRDAAEKFEFFGRSPDEVEVTENDTSPAFFGENAPKRTAIFFNADRLHELSEDTRRYFDVIFVPLTEYRSLSRLASGV